MVLRHRRFARQRACASVTPPGLSNNAPPTEQQIDHSAAGAR
jgi:hypothetical protein